MKKMAAIFAVLSASTVLAAGERCVRNPFWPEGYKGVMTPISAEPRPAAAQKPVEVKPEAEKSAAKPAEVKPVVKVKPPPKPKEATDDDWQAARRTIRMGGTVLARDEKGVERISAMLNGHAYVDHDFISANYGEWRFTWRVLGLSDGGALRLERVRVRRTSPSAKAGIPVKERK